MVEYVAQCKGPLYNLKTQAKEKKKNMIENALQL